MNHRLAKEFRVLWPALALTLTSGLLALLNLGAEPEFWIGSLFVLGSVMMGAETFGHEFQQRTMGILVAQPVARSRVWLEKMHVLAATLALASAAVGVALWILQPQMVSRPGYAWCVLIPVTVLCTTPFWTLLHQNALVGGLVSVIVPGLILGANEYAYTHWLHNRSTESQAAIILILGYCFVCCWGSYRRFRALQVMDGGARELALPPRLEAMLTRPFRALVAPLTGPSANLVRKELRIQQISFLLAGVFVVLNLTGAVLALGATNRGTAELLLICCYFLYVPLVPLLVGTIAVAEEKSWGVTDWQLTLPIGVRRQWSIKIMVAFATSIVLGVVLPLLLMFGGAALLQAGDPVSLPSFHALRSELNYNYGEGDGLAPLSTVLLFLGSNLLGHLLLTSVAIYAGSVCQTTARALVTALAIVVAGGFVVAGSYALAVSGNELVVLGAMIFQPIDRHPVSPLHLLVLGLITLITLFLVCSYHFYRSREPAASRLKMHGVVFVIFCLTLILFTLSGFLRPW